jgi:uncharacterized protein with NRDE domain
MCVVAIAWAAHPRWRLVLAGNRDEFHARPAAPLAHWDSYLGLIAGRDMQSGGTWLGVSEDGRLAVVTNVRNMGDPDPNCVSRGQLITDYVAGNGRYAALDKASEADFNPFNLLVATPRFAQMLSNRPGGTRFELNPGVHGLSNLMLGEPWPRKAALETALTLWISAGAEDPVQLLDVLGDETLLDPIDAPPIFVRDDVYGTRCSTVVAVDATGAGQITERRFGPGGVMAGETTLRFGWRL